MKYPLIEISNEKRAYIIKRVQQDIAYLSRLTGSVDDTLREIEAADWDNVYISLQQCGDCKLYGLSSEMINMSPGIYCIACIDKADARRHEARQNEMVSCNNCNQLYPRRLLTSHWTPPYDTALKTRNGHQYHDTFGNCETCAKECYKRFTRACAVCDLVYLADREGDLYSLCLGCYTPELKDESDRVMLHNRRAQNLNLEASLTLKEWLAILKHFNNKCAYCLGQYQDLEHYISISAGGGTTKKNCLPSCKRCNTRKRDRSIDTFVNLFPSANIERIHHWHTLIRKPQS